MNEDEFAEAMIATPLVTPGLRVRWRVTMFPCGDFAGEGTLR